MQEEVDTELENSRRERRRRAILDAARNLFLRNGYERTTLSDVVALSGGSRSTLADLFGGKEGLFLEVLRESERHVETTFDALETDDAPLEIALKDFARQFLEALLKPQTMALMRILLAEGPRFPETFDTFWRTGPDIGMQKLARYLQRGIDSGILLPVDAPMIAGAFCGMIVGDATFRAMAGMPLAEEVAKALAQVDPVVEIFLSGVRGPP